MMFFILLYETDWKKDSYKFKIDTLLQIILIWNEVEFRNLCIFCILQFKRLPIDLNQLSYLYIWLKSHIAQFKDNRDKL